MENKKSQDRGDFGIQGLSLYFFEPKLFHSFCYQAEPGSLIISSTIHITSHSCGLKHSGGIVGRRVEEKAKESTDSEIMLICPKISGRIL